MEFKNKLYRHHKSKASFVLRHFSIAIIGLFVVAGGVTIPTYISVYNTVNYQTKAEEENVDKTNEKTVSNHSEEDELKDSNDPVGHE